MEVSIELKEINIKNRTCYYFDDIININGLDLDNILLDETTHQNTLTYDLDAQPRVVQSLYASYFSL